MPITHENCSTESRAFCDALLVSLRELHPEAFRVTTSTCAFALPGKNRFAHFYHKRDLLLATVYLRGDEPKNVPPLSNSDNFQLREKLGTKWAEEFPTLIHVSTGASPHELARRLNDFSIPLSHKKKQGATNSRLNDVIVTEGKILTVLSTRFERSRALRDQCLAHFGHGCQGCGLIMSKRYGPIADKLIHVHHIERLADGGERAIDPKIDLIPLCPNCHSVVHLKTPPISLATLREIILD